MVMEILGSVTDLEGYRREVEAEIAELERAAAPEYLAEAGEFARLADELDECDATLGRFEAQLCAFQAQLCSISSDIRALQDASVRSNQRVDNRLAVYERLAGAVAELEVPARLVRRVRGGAYDPCDARLLAELDRRAAYHAASSAAASSEARPLLAELCASVAARAHDRLLQTLAVATAGGTAVCPDLATLHDTQRALLRARPGFRFLAAHAPARAADVRAQYVAAAAAFYESYCRRYAAALVRHAIDAADGARRTDTLGAPEATSSRAHRSGLGSSLGGLFASAERARSAAAARGLNVFALGDRGRVLARAREPAMAVPAPDAPQRYAFEVLWRSIARIALDLARAEAPFLRDFFAAAGAGDADDLAGAVFAPAGDALAALLRARAAASFDAVGVALMLRLTEQGRVAAARAHVACLHAFYRACFDALAQRLRALVDSHIASLRAATPASLAPSGAPLNAAPHYVTRRYAELVAALLAIARPGVDDDDDDDEEKEGNKEQNKEKRRSTGTTATMGVVCEKLPELRDEMESLLHRLCAALPDRDKQSVFLINNYSLVLDVFAEHGLTDGDASGSCTAVETPAAETPAAAADAAADAGGSSDTQHFRAQLLAAVQAFRDAQLITVPVFKRLVLFAAESDPRQRESPEGLAREFAGAWEPGVQRLRTTVLDCFTNLRVAKRIYDSFTDHIVQQYLVLADAIRSSPVLAGACAQYLVDVATLRDGIRRLGGVLEAGLLSR